MSLKYYDSLSLEKYCTNAKFIKSLPKIPLDFMGKDNPVEDILLHKTELDKIIDEITKDIPKDAKFYVNIDLNEMMVKLYVV